jgi:hypothetical protein
MVRQHRRLDPKLLEADDSLLQDLPRDVGQTKNLEA